jgi:hypothetical protein
LPSDPLALNQLVLYLNQNHFIGRIEIHILAQPEDNPEPAGILPLKTQFMPSN